MRTFLETVARGYREKYGDISGLTFIMPNKRSGSFLTKAFADLSIQPTVAPRILSISDFIATVSDKVTDSRIDLLFKLYSCYLSQEGADTSLTFDKFSSWGETILSDFNEIDMQMVDTEEIFKNVYDLNAIRSNFLTSSQRKVMEEYFGYSPAAMEADFNRFWQNFDENSKSGSRKKFMALWQLLKPLYASLKAELSKEGLTTTGGAYREVAEKIEEGYEPFPGEKLVFVGFNALSVSELRIFTALRDMKMENGDTKADFIWDLAPAIFAVEGGPALKYVSINSRKGNFPMPDWIVPQLERILPVKLPEIKVISVPSNVMQAKVAGMELSRILSPEKKEGEGNPGGKEGEGNAADKVAEDIKNARIAIVLPDENLLLPLLYSLPADINNPNLTMGFPLRHTPVIGFASLLRRLHMGAVDTGKEKLFRFEDVKDFLGHPYSALLFPRDTIEKFIKAYEEQRRIMVPLATLETLGENAKKIFRIFKDTDSPEEVTSYILDVLEKLRETLKEKNPDKGGYLRAYVEKIYIGTYIDAIYRLRNGIKDYGFQITPRDVFNLADRMIAGESVVFDGKPLEGLQIMGVLETRCLDFDRIIMLSVNEKVMPRVGRNSTFIPNIVRGAFGMPPANYQEELFSYYFYRVLGRSRDVVLTYDSRSSENRTPGPSRYLLQLKYLVPGAEIHEVEARFGIPEGLQGNISVKKESGIKELLDLYNKLKKNFSASALNHYFQCQLQFLFGDVLRLGEEREKIETIDAIDLGTIIHQSIEHLYFPPDKRGKLLKTPLLITPDFLTGLLEEKAVGKKETRIEREIRKAVLEVHFGETDENKLEKGKLRGSARLIFGYLVRFVKNIIAADLKQAPFRLWGSEIKKIIEYPLPGKPGEEGNGTKVAIKMIIDRLEQAGREGAHEPFRIIDYKTGSVHLTAENIDQIFDGTFKAHNIFQLLLYAELLLMLVREGDFNLPEGVTYEEFENNLRVAIYRVPGLPAPEGVMLPSIGKTEGNKPGSLVDRTVDNMGELRKIEIEQGCTIRGRLEEILTEVLDFDKDFIGTPAEATCRFCEFRLRCETMRAKLENKSMEEKKK